MYAHCNQHIVPFNVNPDNSDKSGLVCVVAVAAFVVAGNVVLSRSNSHISAQPER